MTDRTGLFIFVLIFWIILLPILGLVGGYADSQYDEFELAGGKAGAGLSTSSFSMFYNILFFQLTDDPMFSVPVWVSLILWGISIISAYIAIYFVIDILHGGS